MLFKLSQNKKKSYHFILEETSNNELIQRGYVGQRFIVDTLPGVSKKIKFIGTNGKGFAVHVQALKDLSWAGNLQLIAKAGFKIGIGTMIQSKNSTHIIRLVEVVQ